MVAAGKKLGLLLTAAPDKPSFQHGVALATAALERGVQVYLYCIHDAVKGVGDLRLQMLRQRGLVIYGCAYAAQQREMELTEVATFAGLGVLADIITGTDRFLSF